MVIIGPKIEVTYIQSFAGWLGRFSHYITFGCVRMYVVILTSVVSIFIPLIRLFAFIGFILYIVLDLPTTCFSMRFCYFVILYLTFNGGWHF